MPDALILFALRALRIAAAAICGFAAVGVAAVFAAVIGASVPTVGLALAGGLGAALLWRATEVPGF